MITIHFILSFHSVPLSDTHLTTAYMVMTQELVLLERLSQQTSLSYVNIICVISFGVFVWWCFLFGTIRPSRRTWIQQHPSSNTLLSPSVSSTRLQLPWNVPATCQQIHSHWWETQITHSDILCCHTQHLSSPVLSFIPPNSDLLHNTWEPHQALSIVLMHNLWIISPFLLSHFQGLLSVFFSYLRF